ncbi:acyl carrier protein [Ignavibacterium sp.]|uniref:acyl carrier protein n=1 Tax=Ignavibacterium sp. TaxID=2651167 RepID=UPI00307DB1B6
MISERLKQVILKELKLDSFNFEENTTADQVPGWDSLSHLNVILAVEKEFNIRFKPYELLKLKNIGELQKLIDEKLSK